MIKFILGALLDILDFSVILFLTTFFPIKKYKKLDDEKRSE
jgi:hypothetical protein